MPPFHFLSPRLVLAGSMASLVSTSALADTTDLNAHRHSAECVAVLKRETTALVARFHQGQTEVRPRIENNTAWGFAFVGTSYKNGLRKPQADQLLDSADAALAQEKPEVLASRLAACQAEGVSLLKDANVLERALVNNRARARVKKYLADTANGADKKD